MTTEWCIKMENPFYHMAAIFLPTWSLTGESSLTIGRLLLPLLSRLSNRSGRIDPGDGYWIHDWDVASNLARTVINTCNID